MSGTDQNVNPNGIVNTSIDFNPSDYANINSDVKSNPNIGTDPYNLALHWVAYGQGEQRTYITGQTADYSAIVQVEDLNKALETTDLSISGGELSLNFGPIYKTYTKAGNSVEESEVITKSVQIQPLLYTVPVVYPQTFQYTSGVQLKFTNSFNLDFTNFTNFYIELDGSKYNVDSVETPVLSFSPDTPNLELVKSYWGKTGNIYVKSTATIYKSGEIVSYPAINNHSPNRYLFDVIEFKNPTDRNSRYYKYFLTKYQYGLPANYNNNIFGFFQTELKSTGGVPIVPQTLPLILLDNSNSPLWLQGTSIYGESFINNINYKVNNALTSYRPITTVTFNSVNNTSNSDTTYTGFNLNNFYYNDQPIKVYEEPTWWVYFDNSLNNKITPSYSPDYGPGNTSNLNDTIDVVYGVSDAVNKAILASLDKYLKDNSDLLSLSGGNLTNIVVTNDGNKGTITFMNFVQVKSVDADKNITIELFNDLDDLRIWNIIGDKNKYNVTTKSFLNIKVEYEIDPTIEPNETHEHYNLWGKIIELKSILEISVDTYTAINTKTTINLNTYPVFYCNFTKTDPNTQATIEEKWYTAISPYTSQAVDQTITQTMALYSKHPFLYTASLYTYIANVVPFTFNLPSLLLPSKNLYQNDSCNLDPSINQVLDRVLYSQINYANSFVGNQAIRGPNNGSLDLISLVDQNSGAINVQNSPTNDTPYVNPVYPNPIYDFDTYNLSADSKINVLTAYNYTIVPLLTNTGTIIALNQLYRHFSINGSQPV